MQTDLECNILNENGIKNVNKKSNLSPHVNRKSTSVAITF